MKKDQPDQLAKLLPLLGPLETSPDFTDLLMEQLDPDFSLEQDRLTLDLRAVSKELRPVPSLSFDEELMERLARPAPSRKIYQLIRPRRVAIGTLAVLLLMVTIQATSGAATGELFSVPDIGAMISESGTLLLFVSCVICGGGLLSVDYWLRRLAMRSSQ